MQQELRAANRDSRRAAAQRDGVLHRASGKPFPDHPEAGWSWTCLRATEFPRSPGLRQPSYTAPVSGLQRNTRVPDSGPPVQNAVAPVAGPPESGHGRQYSSAPYLGSACVNQWGMSTGNSSNRRCSCLCTVWMLRASCGRRFPWVGHTGAPGHASVAGRLAAPAPVAKAGLKVELRPTSLSLPCRISVNTRHAPSCQLLPGSLRSHPHPSGGQFRARKSRSDAPWNIVPRGVAPMRKIAKGSAIGP